MLIICKCHGIKKERNTLYKVIVNGKNNYYCSEQDYIKMQEEKESKIIVFNMINDIFGYKVINTAIFKELSEISNIHTYNKISSYIQDNKSQLEIFMRKDFDTEYGKIRYFSTILKNNLVDYKIPKKDKDKEINVEIVNVKYTSRNRKKNLNEYLDEFEVVN